MHTASCKCCSGGATSGSSSGWGVTFSASGGTGRVCGSISSTFSQGGVSGNIGAGWGLGKGASVTVGYTGDIKKWRPLLRR